MKKSLLSILTLIALVFCLSGCSQYVSSYKAVMRVKSEKSSSASLIYHKLEGTDVFKLKCKKGETAKIRYSGELKNGSMTVSYDCGEGKTELFTLHSGEEIDATSEATVSGTVYIIAETSGECTDGNLSFELVYD